MACCWIKWIFTVSSVAAKKNWKCYVSDLWLQTYYRAHFDYFNPCPVILIDWVASSTCHVFDDDNESIRPKTKDGTELVWGHLDASTFCPDSAVSAKINCFPNAGQGQSKKYLNTLSFGVLAKSVTEFLKLTVVKSKTSAQCPLITWIKIDRDTFYQPCQSHAQSF